MHEFFSHNEISSFISNSYHQLRLFGQKYPNPSGNSIDMSESCDKVFVTIVHNTFLDEMQMKSPRSITAARKATQAKIALTDLVRRLGSQAKLPTVRQLCKTMGVSIATLDAALGELEKQGIISRRQGSGIYASSLARTRRVGLVIGYDLFNEDISMFGRLLFRGLQAEARQHDHLLAYYIDDPLHDQDEHGLSQLALDLQSERVEGLMLVAISPERIPEVRAFELPCVFFTAHAQYTPRVCLDEAAQVNLGVPALLEQGCRRIALAYPAGADDAIPPLVAMFKEALAKAGLPAEPSWLVPCQLPGQMRALRAVGHFRRAWLGWDCKPDGLLSYDDNYTAGALHALETLDLEAGKDVKIVSHANKGSNLFGSAPVMRLEIDPVEVARGMIEMIDCLLEGKQPVTQVLRVAPQLILPNVATGFIPNHSDNVAAARAEKNLPVAPDGSAKKP